MSDHDALVRAIGAHPDDDTPRLIFADYLDETGEPDRAAFVRAQVELARTPAWEPFAVLCRHRRRDWSAEGAPFRRTLPRLPAGAEWHEEPFRRGFGWRVGVAVGPGPGWQDIAQRLYEQAPVGELDLITAGATRDDLRRFTAGDWLARVRAVHLTAASPVEPVRALCDAPAAAGITDLHFHVATSPGLPILIDDLLGTPLGGSLRGLSCRLGGTFTFVEDLMDTLAADGLHLERLALPMMELTPNLLRRWCDRGGPHRLAALDLASNYAVGNEGVRVLAGGLAGSGLHTLGLNNTGTADDGAKALAACAGLSGVRRLDLGNNPLTSRAVRALAESEALAGVRALGLARCRVGDKAVRWLTRARFWPTLTELDLRGNPITGPGARHLLNAPVPPDLTAILLDAAPLGTRAAAALRRHFGERLILSEPVA